MPTDTNICYCFKILSSENPTPTNFMIHHKNSLTLIGARNLASMALSELDVKTIATKLNWDIPTIYIGLSSLFQVDIRVLKLISKVQTARLKLNPFHHKGFVVCDGQFQRIKVPSSQFLALKQLPIETKPRLVCHLRSSLSSVINDLLLELVIKLDDEGVEKFISIFSQWRQSFLEIKGKFDSLCCTIEDMFDKIKHIQDKKQLLKTLEDNKMDPFKSVLLSMHKNGTHSARNYFSSVPLTCAKGYLANIPSQKSQ